MAEEKPEVRYYRSEKTGLRIGPRIQFLDGFFMSDDPEDWLMVERNDQFGVTIHYQEDPAIAKKKADDEAKAKRRAELEAKHRADAEKQKRDEDEAAAKQKADAKAKADADAKAKQKAAAKAKAEADLKREHAAQ